MEKRNKIILGVLIVLTIAVLIACILALRDNNAKTITDAIKFRNEYMELNDQTNKDGKVYPTVTIGEKNTVIYATPQKIIELLKSKTGIIYFGYPSCPWCRSLITSLTKVAEELEEPIYYLNIQDIRSAFALEEGKLKKTKEGTKEYYQILKLLDKNLEKFVLEDAEGNSFDTKEKRLYAPTIVSVKDGVVKKVHVSTLKSQKSAYDKLSSSEEEELEKVIKEVIKSKNYEESCSKDDKC